jgi:hypothetical protein
MATSRRNTFSPGKPLSTKLNPRNCTSWRDPVTARRSRRCQFARSSRRDCRRPMDLRRDFQEASTEVVLVHCLCAGACAPEVPSLMTPTPPRDGPDTTPQCPPTGGDRRCPPATGARGSGAARAETCDVPRFQILRLGWYGTRSESAPYFGCNWLDSEARLGMVLAGLFNSSGRVEDEERNRRSRASRTTRSKASTCGRRDGRETGESRRMAKARLIAGRRAD